jgi:prephenate dehydrogenase
VNQRYNVVIWGRDSQKLKKIASDLHIESTIDLTTAVKNADYVMVSVPIDITPSLLLQIAPLMQSNAILFDVTSIKTEVVKTLNTIQSKYPSIRVASIHPMFGPGAIGLKERTIILIDPIVDANSVDIQITKSTGDELEKIFLKNSNDVPRIVRCDGLTHDKIIALTLGLSHAINILFQDILSNIGFKLENISEFGGTTFKIQKILSESVIHEDADTYAHIEMDNAEFGNVLSLFNTELQKYIKMIQSKDIQKFEQLFKKLNEFAAKDTDYPDAYKKMYKMLQSVQETK